MASVTLAPTFGAGYQAFDANGRPLNAGQLYTYAAGTTSQIATYTTYLGNVANANPIVLGTDGRPPNEIWLTLGVSYKFELQDSLGTVIADYDNIFNNQDQAITTIASAASTSDIWSPKGLISFTGNASVVGFPAAPVAGAIRYLYITGTPTFINNGTLIVRGVASGSTITLGLGGIVKVTALTTTSFIIEWVVDGTFSAVGSGFTATVTSAVYYLVSNGLVSLTGMGLTGTSNSAAFPITGLPVQCQPQGTRTSGALDALSGGSSVVATCQFTSGSGTITAFTAGLGTWSTAGVKALESNQIAYMI